MDPMIYISIFLGLLYGSIAAWFSRSRLNALLPPIDPAKAKTITLSMWLLAILRSIGFASLVVGICTIAMLIVGFGYGGILMAGMMSSLNFWIFLSMDIRKQAFGGKWPPRPT